MKESWWGILNSYLPMRVHCSIVHDSQEVEATQGATDQWRDQHNGVYTHTGILSSLKKQENSHCGAAETNHGLVSMRMRLCSVGWGSYVAVAVVQVGSCSSDSTPSLRTSICLGCGPKKTKKKKKKKKEKKKTKNRITTWSTILSLSICPDKTFIQKDTYTLCSLQNYSQ